jgi:hypothetical protein
MELLKLLAALADKKGSHILHDHHHNSTEHTGTRNSRLWPERY